MACSSDVYKSEIETSGNDIELYFQTNIAEFKEVRTRAENLYIPDNLFLMIFDSKGIFIKKEKATLIATNKFKVILPSSSAKRIIHFISGYDLTSFNEAEYMGKDEGEIIPSISHNSMCMWNRFVANNGINANVFDGQTIELIRNKAKFTLNMLQPSNEIALTDVRFALYNTPNKGSIAPFNTSSYIFGSNTDYSSNGDPIITEPSGMEYNQNSEFITAGNSLYSFERNNQSETKYSFIILEGIYSGTKTYYKIEILKTDNINRHDIIRNNHYIINIRSIQKKGYNSKEEAISNPPANNVILSAELIQYPTISNVTSQLEVDKVIAIFTEDNQNLKIQSTYIPNINSPNTVNNANTEVMLDQDDEYPVINGQVTINNGLITAVLHNASEVTEERTAKLIIHNGILYRVVKIILRPSFKLQNININGSENPKLALNQKTEAILKFTINNNVPEEAFPVRFKIFTNNLYTSDERAVLNIDDNNNIYYVYTATEGGEQIINFKTNREESAETIRIESDIFKTENIITTNPEYITITGNIQYEYGFYYNLPYNDDYIARVWVEGLGRIRMTSDGRYEYKVSSEADLNSRIKIYTFTNNFFHLWLSRKSNNITINELRQDTNIRLN